MQTANIHLLTLNGIAGCTSLGNRLNARRLTAVKVSAAYTATPVRTSTHSQKYEKPVRQDEHLKSDRF